MRLPGKKCLNWKRSSWLCELHVNLIRMLTHNKRRFRQIAHERRCCQREQSISCGWTHPRLSFVQDGIARTQLCVCFAIPIHQTTRPAAQLTLHEPAIPAIGSDMRVTLPHLI
jgi:hypothetical protein